METQSVKLPFRGTWSVKHGMLPSSGNLAFRVGGLFLEEGVVPEPCLRPAGSAPLPG
jgi:hypothetical protein